MSKLISDDMYENILWFLGRVQDADEFSDENNTDALAEDAGWVLVRFIDDASGEGANEENGR